jgi:hypothetical protein
MTKEERTELYRSFLTEEGYGPKIDAEGDVTFKYEGGLYFVGVDEKDEQFFRIGYPNFWSIENEAERVKAFQAANYASERTKVAKVFVVRNNTWASVEMFCASPEVFKGVFARCLKAIQVSVQNFREKMQE